MSTLISYRGLNVVSPDPTGAGGLAIQNDFKSLVDWSPRSVWSQTTDPTVNDDQGDDFYPGSMWLRTDVTPPKLFVCKSATTGAAVWQQVPLSVVQDTAPKLGGDLDVNGKSIVSAANGNIVLDPNGTGNVGVNTASPATTMHVTEASGAVEVTIDGKGATTNDNAFLSFLTKGDGTKPFGDANTKGWQFKAHSDTFSTTSYRNDLGIYSWDGTTLKMTMWLDYGGWVGIQTAAPTSRLHVNGPISTNLVTKAADYTLGTADSVVLADSTSGNITLTLPTAVGTSGRQYYIKRITSNANTVSIAPYSGQTIEGSSASYSLATNTRASVTLVSDGANWWVLG